MIPKNNYFPDDNQKESLYLKINDEALASGYYLNPDKEYCLFLMNSLLINENRYSYQSCPCRLADGNKDNDLDIVCPCDYRDADLDEYGMCYCSLYVSKEISKGLKETHSIPERRDMKNSQGDINISKSIDEDNKQEQTKDYQVWRCKVCGYLCARDNPPQICPICKADKEKFEKFKF